MFAPKISLAHWISVVHELRARGWSPRVLFLDATDEVLIRRYNQLRKTRPLQDKRPLEEGIRDERELLADLKNHADLVVDTSRLTSTKLRERLSEFRASGDKGLDIIVESFGFKYGVPLDADFVVDMRFSPQSLLGTNAAPPFRFRLRSI